VQEARFKIWFQTVPPHPSWTAYKDRTTGILTVSSDKAQFTPKSGPVVVIDNVFRVAKGWKASVAAEPLIPIVDTYIQILFGDPGHPSVAYINDARWVGLASFLPHRAILRALRALVPAD